MYSVPSVHKGSGVPQKRSRESAQSTLFSSQLPKRPSLMFSGTQLIFSLLASSCFLNCVVRMNHAVFAALKPGGVYVIADHSSRAGAGLKDAETFHRIDQGTLEEEVEKVGFLLEGEADFLRNPADARDWNDSPRAAGDRRGTSDRFILKFIKPEKPN